ncbi:MAG: hypothetical protein H7Z42_22250 [Roseiflexaceae bacterium]|nr:hypothetical protein [Roseiflexaceae bacterium]
MNTVEEKLRRGFGLVERSESDSDLLGVALLAIQSALEDHLRGALSNHPAVSAEDRQRIIRRELSWATLADLAQRHLALTDDQHRQIVEAQEARRNFIQGNPFRWRISDVLRHGRFVESFCGFEGMLDAVLVERRAERRARPAPAVGTVPVAAPEQERWGWNLTRLAIIAVVLGVIGASIFATYRFVDQILTEINGPQQAAAAPSVVGDAAPAAAPTPTTRRGQIANLGGGPGWLHENPTFASPTLPPQLNEGDPVVLIDEPPVESDDATWVLVETKGYRGWSPANNVVVR